MKDMALFLIGAVVGAAAAAGWAIFAIHGAHHHSWWNAAPVVASVASLMIVAVLVSLFAEVLKS